MLNISHFYEKENKLKCSDNHIGVRIFLKFYQMTSTYEHDGVAYSRPAMCAKSNEIRWI